MPFARLNWVPNTEQWQITRADGRTERVPQVRIEGEWSTVIMPRGSQKLRVFIETEESNIRLDPPVPPSNGEMRARVSWTRDSPPDMWEPRIGYYRTGDRKWILLRGFYAKQVRGRNSYTLVEHTDHHTPEHPERNGHLESAEKDLSWD